MSCRPTVLTKALPTHASGRASRRPPPTWSHFYDVFRQRLGVTVTPLICSQAVPKNSIRTISTCYREVANFNRVFGVVTTLSCSTLNFNYLTMSVRHKCATTFPTTMSFLLLSLLIFFHILTNTKFVHVISTYYHS